MTRPRPGGSLMKSRLGFSKIAAGTGMLVIALALAGCGSSSKSSESPPSTAAKSAPTTAKKVQTAAAKSPCEQAAPTPASPGEVGAGGGGSASVANKASVVAEEHGVRGKVPQVALTAAEKA